MPRAKAVWKRKFRGNQHVRHSRPNSNENEPISPSTPDQQTRPSSSRSTPQSSSSKKLYDNIGKYDEFNGETTNIVISLDILSSVVSTFVCCKSCGGELKLSEKSDKRKGLACLLHLECSNVLCKFNFSFWNSEKCNRPSTNSQLFEINLRMYYGLRAIGKGAEAGKIMCGMMNLPAPSTAVRTYRNALKETLHTVAENSMKKATLEAITENNDSTDIPIAFDGTWQKRGFVSKNGVCTVTSVDTGKVLDVEVLSKYCSGCEKNKNDEDKKAKHQMHCVKNYDGPSGGMETQAAVAICRRSEATRGVKYVKFLGDGDSKSFRAVAEDKPYGDALVEKLECVGHVQKRLGYRLRVLKQKLGSTQLSDGRPIQRRLTGKIIDELQCYYGNAIRSNCDNLENMKRAVWATFFHRLSTDANPQHQLCPPPPQTWCKFRLAQAENKQYTHKHSIPLAVMEAMKPTYRALSDPSLLKRCLHGKTQNVNESFNNIIWSRLPKNTFVGRNILELGVYDSLVTWNDGNVGRLKVFGEFGIKDCGLHTVTALKAADEARVRKADRAALEVTKEARVNRRRKRLVGDEGEENYNPGGF